MFLNFSNLNMEIDTKSEISLNEIPDQIQYIISRLQCFHKCITDYNTVEYQIEHMKMQKRLFEYELSVKRNTLREKKIRHFLEFINIFLFMFENKNNKIDEELSDLFYNNINL